MATKAKTSKIKQLIKQVEEVKSALFDLANELESVEWDLESVDDTIAAIKELEY